MATRFYLGTNDVAPEGGAIVPAFDSSWEQTTSALRSRMVPFKRNTLFANLAIAEVNASTTFDFLFRQYISDTLNAGLISGTVKGIILCLESAADADFRAQMLIKVVNRAGTAVTGTLLPHSAAALTSEFDATTLTNRKFPLAWAGAGTSLVGVTANQGDRLVIELGVRSHNALTASRTATLRFGEASATDAAEDEVSTTDNNPWVEFSQDLSFEDKVLERRGVETPQFTELDRITQPHGGGVSYRAPNASFLHSISTYTSDRSGHDSGLSPLGFDQTPTGRGLSYAPLDAVFAHSFATLASRRRPDGGGTNSLAPGDTTYFKMRALANPGPGYVTWTVTTTPDFSGGQAPAPIQPGSAIVADTWER